MSNQNCFITLTYNDENLPEHASLKKRDFQLFLKRLRRQIGPFRFFSCGEYGSNFGRPHYHALIFGHYFEDVDRDKPLFKTKAGSEIFRSKILEKCWKLGFSSVGDLNFQSAAYIARYTIPKKSGAPAEAHYDNQDPDTGEIRHRKPEYNTMSLKPGIGQSWFDAYGMTDVFPGDSITYQNKKYPVPRFYDYQLSNEKSEHYNPELLATIKTNRMENAKQHNENNTPARLRVRAKIQELKALRLSRDIPNEEHPL